MSQKSEDKEGWKQGVKKKIVRLFKKGVKALSHKQSID